MRQTKIIASRLIRQILGAGVPVLIMAVAAQAQEADVSKTLFLTHSAGYAHDVVTRPAPDQLSFAEVQLTAIMKKYDPRYEVDCTQDCAVLTLDRLKQYHVVVFYTSGELPAPPGSAQALIDYVRGGGNFGFS